MGSWTSKQQTQRKPQQETNPDLQSLTPKPLNQIPVDKDTVLTPPKTFHASNLDPKDKPLTLSDLPIEDEVMETVSEYPIGQEKDPPYSMALPKIALPKSAPASFTAELAVELARPKSAPEPARQRVFPPARKAKSEPVKRAGGTTQGGGSGRAPSQAQSTTSIASSLMSAFWHPQQTARALWNHFWSDSPTPQPQSTVQTNANRSPPAESGDENAKIQSSEDNKTTGQPVAEQNEASVPLPTITEEPEPDPEDKGETTQDTISADQQGQTSVPTASDGGTKVNVQISIENPEMSNPVQVLEEVIAIDKILQPTRPLPEEIYQAALKGMPETQLQEDMTNQAPLVQDIPETDHQNQGIQELELGTDVLALFNEEPEVVEKTSDPLGPVAKFVRPAGYALAVGAGIASLVGVVVGYNKIRGWLKKRKGVKEEGKRRRRRHVRDWSVMLE